MNNRPIEYERVVCPQTGCNFLRAKGETYICKCSAELLGKIGKAPSGTRELERIIGDIGPEAFDARLSRIQESAL